MFLVDTAVVVAALGLDGGAALGLRSAVGRSREKILIGSGLLGHRGGIFRPVVR